MAHTHDIRDDDGLFKIDADSRLITYTGDKSPVLIQGDHNSEQFTFEMPKIIDGHDVTLCNVIRVHFLNVSADNPIESSPGVYDVKDLVTKDLDPSTVRFTWLISNEGTMFVGTLNFIIELLCMTSDNVKEYSWHTEIYSDGIVVSKGMDNSELIIGKYYDVLEQWVARIEAEANVSTGNALNRINEATNAAVNGAKADINDHANTVRKDLAVYGLGVSDVLTHERGYSQDKVMSQEAVTRGFDLMQDGVDNKMAEFESDMAEFESNLESKIANGSAVISIPCIERTYEDYTNVNVSSLITAHEFQLQPYTRYRIHSNKTDTSWGVDLTIGVMTSTTYRNITANFPPFRNCVKYVGGFLPAVTSDASSENTLRIISCSVSSRPEDFNVDATLVYEFNGEKKTVTKTLEDPAGLANVDFDVFDIDEFNVTPIAYVLTCSEDDKGTTTVINDSLFTLDANGIRDIKKVSSETVSHVGVVHTYNIIFDNGTVKEVKLSDGVGISDTYLSEHGEYEDTYKMEFTNGEYVTFKVPNNNTVGIRTSVSGAHIHGTDLIPLEHTVKVSVRSKNLIPYPYVYSYGLVNGVTFTNNNDGSITANGTVNDGTFANVMVAKKLPLEAGKTYYVGDSQNLLFAYKDDVGAMQYLKNGTITWKDTYEFIQLYIQFQPNATVDETLYPMFCESDAAVDYVPPVDLSTVKLKKCGKNLLPPSVFPIIDGPENGLTFTRNADGSLIVNGTSTALVVKNIINAFNFKAGVTYTLSGCPSGGGTGTYRFDNTDRLADDGSGGVVTYDVDTVHPIRLRIASGVTLDNLVLYPQLEVGDTATEFEAYVGAEYDLASDGNPISRVTSLMPTMNLLTDKAGTIIDATYNVDQTAAYNKINALLETLLNGGA